MKPTRALVLCLAQLLLNDDLLMPSAFEALLRASGIGDSYVLSFPQRRDRTGRGHALVKPVDDAARAKIERQVLAQLDLERLDAPEADDG